MAHIRVFNFFAIIFLTQYVNCIPDLTLEDSCETLPSEIHLIKGKRAK